MRHRRLPTLLVLLACVCAAPAVAQGFTFAGIPWGTPADSVRARLEGAGYTYRGFVEHGDRGFEGEHDELRVVMRADRLVGAVRFEFPGGTQPEARFRAVADSLAREHGPPTMRSADAVAWRRGFTELHVAPVPPGGDAPPALSFVWTGPGYHEELTRRGAYGLGFPALEPGWAVIAINTAKRAALDTTMVSPRGGGVFRARWRFDSVEEQRGPYGPVDAAVETRDVDCANRRLRMITGIEYRNGRLVHDWGETMRGEWEPLAQHPDEVTGFEVVCARGGFRAPAAVTAAPAYPALAAPWVVVVEGTPGRLAVDTASFARAAAGVELRWRHDFPNASAAPYPDTDRIDSRARFDCAGGRFMLMSMTTFLRGRQGQSVTVPAAQRRWASFHSDNDVQQVTEFICSPAASAAR